MFDVWCVWWICHIVNSQLRKSAFTSTAKWWFAVFETTRSICVALHKGWHARIREGLRRVLRLMGGATGPHLPPPRPSKITPPNRPRAQTFSPLGEAATVEQGPNTKCMTVRLPHLFNFPNYHPERLPGLMRYHRQIIFQMGKVHSPQMEGGKKKKIYPNWTAVKYFQSYNWD